VVEVLKIGREARVNVLVLNGQTPAAAQAGAKNLLGLLVQEIGS
jgi:hypothetical protein